MECFVLLEKNNIWDITIITLYCFLTTLVYPERFGHRKWHKRAFLWCYYPSLNCHQNTWDSSLQFVKELTQYRSLNWWKNAGQSISENSNWCADNEENCLDSKQSARLTHPPSPHAGTVLAHHCYRCLVLRITWNMINTIKIQRTKASQKRLCCIFKFAICCAGIWGYLI